MKHILNAKFLSLTLVTALMLSMFVASACSSDEEEPEPELVTAIGQTLRFASYPPVAQPYIRYSAITGSGDPQDYVMLTELTGTELVMVNLIINNPSDETVQLNINAEAADLTLADGSAIKPINPIQRALLPTEDSDPQFTVEGFLPMWGDVPLNSNHQLDGYLVFEVPIDSEVDGLQWKAADTATINYE